MSDYADFKEKEILGFSGHGTIYVTYWHVTYCEGEQEDHDTIRDAVAAVSRKLGVPVPLLEVQTVEHDLLEISLKRCGWLGVLATLQEFQMEVEV